MNPTLGDKNARSENAGLHQPTQPYKTAVVLDTKPIGRLVRVLALTGHGAG